MKDQTSIDRIKELHPAFRETAEKFINECEAVTGYAFRISEGLRTFEYQNDLYAQGRTKPGKIVTRAKGGQSIHCYGCAIDIVRMDGNEIDWKFDYRKLRQIYPKYNLIWGADWDNDGKMRSEGDSAKDEPIVDQPHYQMKNIPHWSELLKRYDKKNFIKFTKYVRL